ncbi:uncharacterized protein LOC141679589 [Apium graveolens]|uniref:uncharacterized protein LOC141679589 n=1 Tax=Apium graveolens TaxID=4045 RepID=UPI003D7B1715
MVEPKIGAVAYKFGLPNGSRVHPVFHVSLFEKRIGDAEVRNNELPLITDDGEIVMEPEAILDTRWFKKGSSFEEEQLVKWKKLPVENATWENAKELKDKFLTLNLADKIPLKGGGILLLIFILGSIDFERDGDTRCSCSFLQHPQIDTTTTTYSQALFIFFLHCQPEASPHECIKAVTLIGLSDCYLHWGSLLLLVSGLKKICVSFEPEKERVYISEQVDNATEALNYYNQKLVDVGYKIKYKLVKPGFLTRVMLLACFSISTSRRRSLMMLLLERRLFFSEITSTSKVFSCKMCRILEPNELVSGGDGQWTGTNISVNSWRTKRMEMTIDRQSLK